MTHQLPTPPPPIPVPPAGHPLATTLRQRAAELRALAASVEGAQVTALPELAAGTLPEGPRFSLAERLLGRSLGQLHEAAEGLRITASGFQRRADEIDAGHRVGRAA